MPKRPVKKTTARTVRAKSVRWYSRLIMSLAKRNAALLAAGATVAIAGVALVTQTNAAPADGSSSSSTTNTTSTPKATRSSSSSTTQPKKPAKKAPVRRAAPPAPSNLIAYAGGDSVNVRWSYSERNKPNVKYYRIYRDGKAVGKATPSATKISVYREGTRFDDKGIELSQSYKYQVKAYMQNGTSSRLSKALTIKTPATTTPTPKIEVDSKIDPVIKDWVNKTVIPEMLIWYPKISDALGYPSAKPPTKFKITTQNKPGVVASAGDGAVKFDEKTYKNKDSRNDTGAAIHEMTHIIQDYRGKTGDTNVPKWLREGIADYAGNIIYGSNPPNINYDKNYDEGYQTSAGFLDWVVRKEDPEFVRRINTAGNKNKYSDKLLKLPGNKSLKTAWEEMKAAAPAKPKSKP